MGADQAGGGAGAAGGAVKRAASRAGDRRLARDLSRWFDANARALPWRVSPRDPYLSLLSEFMLQQTQVGRVLEKWGPFAAKFPTLRALAGAGEAEVLAAWSGLGYYRRARLLHAAAREVCERFGGRVPSEAEALRGLPGVGRYTAGAIASIVFGRPEPIVDGNVARVLLRLEGKRLGPECGAAWAWERAEELVAAAERPGVFNEALMELGATVCTPRGPRCGACPVRGGCRARKVGAQERIPARKRGVERSTLWCAAVVVRDGRGRLLLERRPMRGLFAGLWQAPTLESPAAPSEAEISGALGVRDLRPRGSFEHVLSHRLLRFTVYEGRGGAGEAGRRWCAPAQLGELALSNAQRRAIALVMEEGGAAACRTLR